MIAGGIEMIVGVKSDPVVGPAVVCGFGGILVEVMRDVAVRVPPFDAREAGAMLAELRGAVEPQLWDSAQEVFFFLTRAGRAP